MLIAPQVTKQLQACLTQKLRKRKTIKGKWISGRGIIGKIVLPRKVKMKGLIRA